MAVPPTQNPIPHDVVDGGCSPNRPHSCSNLTCVNRPYGTSEKSPTKGSLDYSDTRHSPPNSGCYGYSSASDDFYTCPGHRDPSSSRPRADLETPPNRTIVFCEYLNHLHNILNKEITDSTYGRQKHAMYANFPTDSTTVNNTQIAKAIQPNSLEMSIENLRSKIAEYEDKANANTIDKLYSPVNSSNIIKKDNIFSMYTEINNKWNDCVCHNDCVSFGRFDHYHTTCVCNGNCGCDYGIWGSR